MEATGSIGQAVSLSTNANTLSTIHNVWVENFSVIRPQRLIGKDDRS